jgi:hypothetical protein
MRPTSFLSKDGELYNEAAGNLTGAADARDGASDDEGHQIRCRGTDDGADPEDDEAVRKTCLVLSST